MSSSNNSVLISKEENKLEEAAISSIALCLTFCLFYIYTISMNTDFQIGQLQLNFYQLIVGIYASINIFSLFKKDIGNNQLFIKKMSFQVFGIVTNYYQALFGSFVEKDLVFIYWLTIFFQTVGFFQLVQAKRQANERLAIVNDIYSHLMTVVLGMISAFANWFQTGRILGNLLLCYLNSDTQVTLQRNYQTIEYSLMGIMFLIQILVGHLGTKNHNQKHWSEIGFVGVFGQIVALIIYDSF